LPPFNFYSGQLSVSKQNGVYRLRILLGDSVYRKDAVTYVIGISRDSLAFASVGKGQYETTVGERSLPEGTTSFYLFDRNFKLLSERSIYVQANNINVNITTDKNIYSRHDKVLVNLSATDATQRLFLRSWLFLLVILCFPINCNNAVSAICLPICGWLTIYF
jgi:hypothetical protein